MRLLGLQPDRCATLPPGVTLTPARTTVKFVAKCACRDYTVTKAQANKLAAMSHDGLSRSINPVHTAGDGDAMFAVATGGSGKPGWIPPVQHHLCTGCGQTFGQSETDALRRPGDQCPPPCQIEKLVSQGLHPFSSLSTRAVPSVYVIVNIACQAGIGNHE